MQVLKDISYLPNSSLDAHKLDIYIPELPNLDKVLLYCHGGAWISGKKEGYKILGEGMANRGFIVCIFNYRLTVKGSSEVIFPAHYEDVSAAIQFIINKIDSLVLNGSSKSGNVTAPTKQRRFLLSGQSCGVHLNGYVLLHLLPRAIVDQISHLISIEGIYDIETLATRYPTYNDWFLDHVFKSDRKPLTLLTKFPAGVELVVLHSDEDELIDTKHALEFADYHGLEVTKLKGSHDGVLETDLLFDIMASYA